MPDWFGHEPWWVEEHERAIYENERWNAPVGMQLTVGLRNGQTEVFDNIHQDSLKYTDDVLKFESASPRNTVIYSVPSPVYWHSVEVEPPF